MISIEVNIAGRTYPLKIQEKDAETIRSIVDDVNGKIRDFQLAYPAKDRQDCLAMALLTYAVDLHKNPSNDEMDDVVGKINQIDTLLESLLS